MKYFKHDCNIPHGTTTAPYSSAHIMHYLKRFQNVKQIFNFEPIPDTQPTRKKYKICILDMYQPSLINCCCPKLISLNILFTKKTT